MYHQEFEVAVALRNTIKCFWYNRRDFEEQGDEKSNTFEVVPDGYAELIFYFGDLSNKADNGDLVPMSSPFLMGLPNEPVYFYSQKPLEIIGVRFFPWSVSDVLGLPASKASRAIVEHPLAGLQTKLGKAVHAGQFSEAVDLLNIYFLTAQAQIAPNTMLAKAGAAMTKAKGNLPVSQVAALAHATVRTLERQFKQAAAHTVKDVASLMRFEQVRNRLWHEPDSNIAGLAHELGYADQSHLSREFKRYTGLTPAAFARNAKKNLQAGQPNFVAFVQD